MGFRVKQALAAFIYFGQVNLDELWGYENSAKPSGELIPKSNSHIAK